MPAQTPPRWDLTNVYPSLQSPEFAAAIQTLQEKIKSSEILMARAESLDLSAYPSAVSYTHLTLPTLYSV